MEEASVDVKTKQNQAESTDSGNENEQQTLNRVSLNSHSKDEVLDSDREKQILTDENSERTGETLSQCQEGSGCDKPALSEDTVKTCDSGRPTSLSPGHNNVPPLQGTESEPPTGVSNGAPKLVDKNDNSSLTTENVEAITQETVMPPVGQCNVGVNNSKNQEKPVPLATVTADRHSVIGDESKKPGSNKKNEESSDESKYSRVEHSNVDDTSTTEEKLETLAAVTTDSSLGDKRCEPKSTERNESSDGAKSPQQVSSTPAEHSRVGDEASAEGKLASITSVTTDCHSSLGDESKSTKTSEESNDNATSPQHVSSPAELSNAVDEANTTEEKLKFVQAKTDCHSALKESDEPNSTEKKESSNNAESDQKLEVVSSSAGQNQSSRSQDDIGPIVAEEKSDISSTLGDKASTTSEHNEKKTKSPVGSPSSSNDEREKHTRKEPGLDTSIEIINVLQGSKQEKQKGETEVDESKRVNCVEISSSESDCDSSSEKYDSDEVYCLSDDDDLICVSDKSGNQKSKIAKTNPSMSYQCGEVTYSIIREGLAKKPRDNPPEKDSSLEPNITIELIPISKGANTDKRIIPPTKKNGSKADDSIWLISDDEADKPDEVVSSKRKREDHSTKEGEENSQVNLCEAKKPRKDSDEGEQRIESKKTLSNAEENEKQSETPPNVNPEGSPHSRSSNEVEVLSVSDDSSQGTDGIDSEKDSYDENSINSVVVYNDEMMDYTYSDPIYVESDSDKESVPSLIQITSVTSSVSHQTKDSAVTSSDTNEMDHETQLEPEVKEQKGTSSAGENPSDQPSVNSSTISSSAGEAKENCEQSSEITDSGT